MKPLFSIALFALLVLGPVSAQTIVTAGVTHSSTMPGQANDFTFFGNPHQFPVGTGSITYNYTTGTAVQPTDLADFIAVVGNNADATYGAQSGTAPAYGSIVDPAGILEKTGIIYDSTGVNPGPGILAPDLAAFILGPNTGTFNFADFNVYVMISNAPTSGLSDSAVLATLYDPTGAVGLTPTLSFALTDDTTTTGVATFADFHVTGASAGDVLKLGAAGSPGSAAYLSGVSFKSSPTPEPSTNMLIIASLAALAFSLRQGRRFASSRL